MTYQNQWRLYISRLFGIGANVISLARRCGLRKNKLQLKNKYNAKRKYD